jgi:hypothetical protein
MNTEYTADDYTHRLMCRHCFGKSVKHYYMKCIKLGETKSGKVKVLVFGDRYWGRLEEQRIRYVSPDRLLARRSGSPVAE